MARLPNVRRLSRDSVRGAPAWFEPALRFINTFADGVYRALDRGLTFQENFVATIRELEFETASDYTSADTWTEQRFQTGLRVRAMGVVPLQIQELANNEPVVMGAVTLDWTERDGQIVIRWVTGLEDSKRYRLRVLVV